MAVELQPENARGRGVDHTQPHALPGSDREALANSPVYRDGVADPPGMAHVVTIAEIVADGGIIAQAPVAENPDDLAVHTDRLALFDDQRTVQAAADLLEAALVRVVPICASIRQVEGIGEGLARSDRLLRQVRDAVHGIRQSDAVPVHGCLLVETVFYEHSRSEEHTSELRSLMRISYAVFCLQKKNPHTK